MGGLSKNVIFVWQDLVRGDVLEKNAIVESSQETLAEVSCVLPRGGRTKSALLAAQSENIRVVDCREWRGVISYDPSEFLITAASGTEIGELQDVLARHGQYLPFDPLFADQGATLGGTVAAGLSGPCSLLYGSLRDFVMEVEFIDGLGQLVRGGGKVVKNAAGFDFPKLMVGSYGRLGILTEITLKVLPSPQSRRALVAGFSDFSEAVNAAQRLACEPLPLAAAQIDESCQLTVQFAGLSEALGQVEIRAGELLGQELSRAESEDVEAGDFALSSEELLLRLVISPPAMSRLLEQVQFAAEMSLISASPLAGVAWVKVDNLRALEEADTQLSTISAGGVVVCGATRQLTLLGECGWLTPARQIQSAMDPGRRFLPFR